MAMGYIKGKFWVLDPVYDEYPSLPCAKALSSARLRAVKDRTEGHVSIEINYSYIGRTYMCEVFRMWKPEKSANYYKVSIALAYGSHPLEAEMAAIRACEDIEKTELLQVCFLECEVWLLARAIQLGAEEKRKTIAKLQKTLKLLEQFVDKAEEDERPSWDEVFSDMEKTSGGYVDRAGMDRLKKQAEVTSIVDEDDDL